MDFGVGFLSNNVMLPILDFFYGIVPSYGLAIVALTLVVRFALYPLSAGSIRNMRRMKVAQPAMQEKIKEIQQKYKDDPAAQQKAVSEVYKEFGNPLAGCLPLVVQMPVLFALFATLRGSPFSDVPYMVNLQILPREQITEVQPQAYLSKPQNIYVADGVHVPVVAVLPGGNHLAVGEKTDITFQTTSGDSLKDFLAKYPDAEIQPTWKITKGEGLVKFDENGNLEALAAGDVTIQGTVQGLAANKGFLFIKALGRVGAFGEDGSVNWDIMGMVIFFGVSLYVNQLLSGQGPNANPQQATANRITPIVFSGMFLFFPLPAGVLMYMTIANLFQTLQTFILNREPLPENLQKILDEQEKKTNGRGTLPFEPGQAKKEASATSTKKETPVKKETLAKRNTNPSPTPKNKKENPPTAKKSSTPSNKNTPKNDPPKKG
jgi:YidC/Oxa1 family membrane protein insertase